ncbi:hypothetical protein ACN28S_51825 [Cystobacter fuscus]
MYIGGALGCALLAFPFFRLIDTQQTGLVWLAITLGIIAHAAMYGPQASFFSELFGTRVRYSGASLGYQLASVFAGGLSPLIATALLSGSNGQAGPCRCTWWGSPSSRSCPCTCPRRRSANSSPSRPPRLLPEKPRRTTPGATWPERYGPRRTVTPRSVTTSSMLGVTVGS